MERKRGDERPTLRGRSLRPTEPTRDELIDRAAGAAVGAVVGEALGMGIHWQYDLEALQQQRGCVTGYTTPLPGTYHAGKLVAGQTTMPGAVAQELLKSLSACRGLDQGDFHKRFDAVLRAEGVDGTRSGGPWGWTDKVLCELYRSRVVEGRQWAQCAVQRSDTTDTIVRAAMLAARYHASPAMLCSAATAHAAAQTLDEGVIANSAAFACLVGGAIQGVPLVHLSDVLYQQADDGVLPFSILKGHRDTEGVPEPDGLLWFGAVMKGAGPNGIGASIEPAHLGVTLYGQFCAYFACLPSAYYCVARFPADLRQAAICSLNGGGQNTQRTALVCALMGAAHGLSSIPRSWIDGLQGSSEIVEAARQIAADAVDPTLQPASMKHDQWGWCTVLAARM